MSLKSTPEKSTHPARRNALIMFVKAPLPGRVKTRLQPQLTADQSLQFYRAIGSDLATLFRASAGYDFRLYFWPPEERLLVEQWLGADLFLAPQSGADLGEKMHRALSETLAAGYTAAVLVGSDLPFLTEKMIDTAFRELQQVDAVLGPTEDGGYYLVGMKAPHREAFENIPWSTAQVWRHTVANLKRAELTYALLPAHNDVDTYADLQRLWRESFADPGSDASRRLPQVRAVLNAVFQSV